MAPTRREFAWGVLACTAFSGAGRAAIPDPYMVGASGVDLKSMDRAVAPGDDFFRYVNGGWLRDTPIPATGSGGRKGRAWPKQLAALAGGRCLACGQTGRQSALQKSVGGMAS
jgi:hypothetical protein